LLRLFLQIKENRLRVRSAYPEDKFENPKVWKNQLEFEYSPDSNYMMAWTSLLPDLGPEGASALLSLLSARYPISQDYQELQKLCPELVFGEDAPEWVFYGGSFNPWHKGHQACLNLLPQEKVCFILPDISPHKEIRQIEPVANILELSSKARFSKNQFLVPTFLLNNAVNPTVDWMERLKKNFPSQKLSLLMGFDSFANLTNWTRASDLLPILNTVYVASRLEDEGLHAFEVQKVRKLAPAIEIVFLGRHEFERISSTDLRKR
jgi:nicotinate (nicotinamide) nucleotide adenylyltransferase